MYVFTGWIGKQFSKLRSETALKTDERIRIMSEIINGIKVIKMYAWEYSFAKMIQEARRQGLINDHRPEHISTNS